MFVVVYGAVAGEGVVGVLFHARPSQWWAFRLNGNFREKVDQFLSEFWKVTAGDGWVVQLFE